MATSRLQRALRRQRGDAGLTEGQFAVLAALSKHGPLNAGVLAEHEGMRPPSMTRIIHALGDLGFVAKEGHPEDGRQVVVTLTDAGRAEFRETRRRQDDWLSGRLATLDMSDRELIAQACVILLKLTER